MFYETSILYDVTQGKWINQNTVAPLTKLQVISGMFGRIRVNSSLRPSGTSYYASITNTITDYNDNTINVIDSQTFSNNNKLTNINSLFESTSIGNALIFTYGFINGSKAFYDTRITEIDTSFVSDTYIYKITNVTSMFYSFSSRNINNLGSFITKLKNKGGVKMSNVAGNLSNSDIDNVYKESLNIVGFGGHNLTTGRTVYA